MSYKAAIYLRGVLILFVAALLALLFNICALAADARVKAFVNVNVIPMDTERVLRDFTVVVDGDTISALGPSSSQKPPFGAKVIDGKGAFLMPGLADMHMHLPPWVGPGFLPVFLGEGVTTVRNFTGQPVHLEWRDEVIDGSLIGPTIHTAGPMIVGPPDMSVVWIFRALVIGVFLFIGAVFFVTVWFSRRLRGLKVEARRMGRLILPSTVVLMIVGVLCISTKAIPINLFTSLQYPFVYVPDTEARARAEVRRQLEAGYDFVKVYDYLTREQYRGAIEEARRVGIYVVGHMDHGIAATLSAGLQEVAHVDEFIDEHLAGDISPKSFEPVPINSSGIAETVTSVVNNGAIVVSNMVTDVVTYEYLEGGPGYFRRSEYKVIPPDIIERWGGNRMVKWQGQQGWRRDTIQPFLEDMIRALYDAKAGLLIGTDLGVDGAVPSHIHRELTLLVDAGLSPYAALTAGTANARMSVNRMGGDDAFGEVAVGLRADLILLESNPLEDVRATRRRLGVMSRGRWYTKAELDKIVSELVGTYLARKN